MNVLSFTTAVALLLGGPPRSPFVDGEPAWFLYQPRADLRARISADVHVGEITFFWEHSADGWASVASATTQRVPVGYVPTDWMLMSGPHRLVVAGSAPRGETVIEVWELGVPEVVWTTDPATAESVASLVAPPIAAVHEICREAAVGRERVLALFRDQSSLGSHAVFVFFESSRDVYALDLVTGDHSPAFSSSESAEVPVQPSLKYPFDNFWASRHRDHGAVYVFAVHASATALTLVLRDWDADGTLDDSIVVQDLAAWEALGFAGDSGLWGE